MTFPSILEQPLRLPVLAAPMFIASGPELVKAQRRSGIIGSFPALNARTTSQLDEWLVEIAENNALAITNASDNFVAPFAVNHVVHRSNKRLEADMELIVEHQVPIVITSLGTREEVFEAVHSYGGIALHDVTHNHFAHKAIERGADGLIAVAAGAGGHTGHQSPFALLSEIREWFTGPLLLSGAIAHGRSILAALTAGADMAYVGSAFLATSEANVPEAYRKMIVDSHAQDIIASNYFTGVFGNYLRPSILAAGLDPDKLPSSSAGRVSPMREDHPEGPKPWRDIWGAGHGIGSIKEQLTTHELVTVLTKQYNDALVEQSALIQRTKQRHFGASEAAL